MKKNACKSSLASYCLYDVNILNELVKQKFFTSVHELYKTLNNSCEITIKCEILSEISASECFNKFNVYICDATNGRLNPQTNEKDNCQINLAL